MKNVKRLIYTLAAAGLTATPLVANAYDAGDWLVRGRVIHVSPNDSSGSLSTVPGSGASVDSDTTIEVDFTYMYNKRFGVELILASSEHDGEGTGTLSALGKIFDARTLPPTLTLQYHFNPDQKIQPYAGIGLNYTLFFNENGTSSLDTALGGSTSVNLDDSVGVAAQLGADIKMNNDWFVNIDVKYIDMDTTGTLTTAAVTRTIDVDIDPWIFGIGIGKRF